MMVLGSLVLEFWFIFGFILCILNDSSFEVVEISQREIIPIGFTTLKSGNGMNANRMYLEKLTRNHPYLIML